MSAAPGFLRHALHNGAPAESDRLRAAQPDPGFAEADGVFETVRVLGGRPVGLAEHMARLAGALRALDAVPVRCDSSILLLPADEQASALGSTRSTIGADVARQAERCAVVITANALVAGSLKIAVFREAGAWSETILARPPGYAPAQYAAGFRLQTLAGDAPVGRFCNLKTLHRPHHQAARAAAVAAGFDEALWIDRRGRVLEGSVTNVFVVCDGIVSTPTLSSGILPGVMRARVIQLLGPATVRERDIGIGELRQAQEVFVTNALLGVMPVAQVDDTAFDLQANSVTRSLMAVLADQLGSLNA